LIQACLQAKTSLYTDDFGKSIVNKIIFYFALFSVMTSAVGQSLNLDLTSTPDIAAGNFDLDKIYLGSNYYGNARVAGIYQHQTDDVDLGNVAEIRQMDGEISFAMIWQYGFNHEAHISQSGGENNIARLAQSGSGHYANLVQLGTDNLMTVQMLGENARIEAFQLNAVSNVLSVVLNSGAQLKITQTGEGNIFKTVLAPNTVMNVTQTGQ
jgi:hypothetical protein